MDAIDSVCRVDVLDQHNLEAGGTALARGNSGPGEEEFPDLKLVSNMTTFYSHKASLERVSGTYAEPSLSVLGLNVVAVGHPVPVPSP